MRTINDAGLSLIKQFESCRLESYQDGNGIWTIGWGHIRGIKQGMTCTQEQADTWLKEEVTETCRVLDGLIPAAVNSNQFSACVCLAYNIGVGSFRSSTLLKKLRDNDWASASDQFLAWNKIGGSPSKGLSRRRQAEQKLFNEPV